MNKLSVLLCYVIFSFRVPFLGPNNIVGSLLGCTLYHISSKYKTEPEIIGFGRKKNTNSRRKI